MKIGVPKEISKGEARVALTPTMVTALARDNHEILIESGAGVRASFVDGEYEKAGARIVKKVESIYNEADVLLKVQPPVLHSSLDKHEAELFREGAIVIGFLAPFTHLDVIATLARRKITAFAMEFIPRITRAQSMDALSSMASLAGYKAVMIAASRLSKIFPLMMTAAGTIHPANVLVLGAGVAGLQAIATAKRLGAKVEAFDPRPAVKEQVQSLGATFIEMEVPEDVETAGGYAKELSADFIKKEREAIAARLPKMDVVICAAQVFGKRAPLLLTGDMVKLMRPGSIVVDLAADQGGNCELTEADKVVEKDGVTIVGTLNLPATVPVHASEMYARNVTNFFKHIFQAKDGKLNFEDQITRDSCITRDGQVVNDMIQKALQEGGFQK